MSCKVEQKVKSWGLPCSVLSQEDPEGRTILEKFEQVGAHSSCAVAIFSADDLPAHARARDNVTFETGWFFGKLGRDKVIILREASCELPGDMQGINYLPYENGKRWDGKRLRSSLEKIPEAKAIMVKHKKIKGQKKKAKQAVCNVWIKGQQQHCQSVPKEGDTCARHRGKKRCDEGCRKTSGH